jgi:murein L,D-transpeptidase YafK
MLHRILILSFITLTLHASSILTDYRTNGLEGIEKKMDQELTKKEYWDQHLKNMDTNFGYIESYNSVLTCNKEKSTLSLFKYNGNGQFLPVEKYNAFTGKVKGDKIREGDLKTPVGIYNIEKKISKLDSFYGPLAFVTNYPNIYDKYRGKNGSGIWIHGLPTEQERDDYTKGCIAINNSNMLCLDKEVDIDSTLLLINPAETKQNVSKTTLTHILSNLYSWRYSWIYNDIDKYLSFYSKEFKRHNGMKYSRFVKYKTRVFNKNEKKKIVFNDINVLPYPNTENIFQISFKEFYKSKSFTFEGDKILIVKVDNSGKFKILTEK